MDRAPLAAFADWLRRHVPAASAVFVLLLIAPGAVPFGTLLFYNGRELVYHGTVEQLHCQAGSCYLAYRIELGNTGMRDLEEVRVRLSAGSAGLRYSHHVSNLSAAHPRSHEPEVEVREQGEQLLLSIRRLAAGASLVLSLDGRSADPERNARWRDLGVVVEAPGHVTEGIPRMSVFVRALYTLFGFFV